jgi:hypothetical protein
MITPTLNQVEELIGYLSHQEQLWLLERLAQRLRRAMSPATQPGSALSFHDPSVQAELRAAGDRLLREAESQRAHGVRAWNQALTAMGFKGQPIGANALRQMMVAEGISPGGE